MAVRLRVAQPGPSGGDGRSASAPPHVPVPLVRSAGAVLLLAAFAVGGVLVPAAHEAAHGWERLEARAALAGHADDGHHHDEVGHTHGPEVQAPCPTPVALHLDCATCVGLSVSTAQAEAPALTPRERRGVVTLGHAPPASASVDSVPIRGPPLV